MPQTVKKPYEKGEESIGSAKKKRGPQQNTRRPMKYTAIPEVHQNQEKYNSKKTEWKSQRRPEHYPPLLGSTGRANLVKCETSTTPGGERTGGLATLEPIGQT